MMPMPPILVASCSQRSANGWSRCCDRLIRSPLIRLPIPGDVMVKLLVLYGHPQDPAAFDKYYQEVHIPLAKRMRGLKKWTIGKVLGTPDGQPAPYYYVAELYMESRADFERLLFETPEGRAAV